MLWVEILTEHFERGRLLVTYSVMDEWTDSFDPFQSWMRGQVASWTYFRGGEGVFINLFMGA